MRRLIPIFLLALTQCHPTSPPSKLAQAETRKAKIPLPTQVDNPAVAITPLARGNTGTVRFLLHTPQPYLNGLHQPDFTQTLITLPNLAVCELHRTTHSVDLNWRWPPPPSLQIENQKSEIQNPAPSFATQLVELPGPETYLLQFTWDASRGLCEAYLNGTPMTLPGTRFPPFSIPASSAAAEIPAGPNTIDQLTITNTYTPPDEIKKSLPENFRNQHADLLGYPAPNTPLPQPLNIASRLGKLLLNLPLDNSRDLAGWKMEGPGQIDFPNHTLQLRSADPTKHLVFWCPQNLPDRFVADWDFAPVSRFGLAIVFFAAQGDQGQDIFDPALPPRNATFSQYTAGRIVSYHISYFANLSDYQTGRTTSNLRKNNQFFALAQGPIAVPPFLNISSSNDAPFSDAATQRVSPGTTHATSPTIENQKSKIENPPFSHLRLIKDGPHIQLLSNNKVSIDFTDNNPTRFGPPLTTGKFALRQMSETIAQYKNLQIHELTP